MKKLLSVLLALTLTTFLVFAQDPETKQATESETTSEATSTEVAKTTTAPKAWFKNVVHTDTVLFGKDGSLAFAGAYNDMQAGYNSDILDIYARGRIVLNKEYANYIGFNHAKTRFGIKYKPGYGIELGIGQAYYIPGSYMAVEGDYVVTGNIGAPGFNFAYKPVDGVTLVTGFDFISGVYNNTIYDSEGNYLFNTGFGGWYEFKPDGAKKSLFTIGAAFEYHRNSDVTNPFHAGAYFSCNPIEGLGIYTGYTYNSANDDLYICGSDHAINFSISYEVGDFYCAFDYDTDTTDNLYSGLTLGYVVESFDFSVCAQDVTTYSDFLAGNLTVHPECAWKVNGKNTLKFGFAVEFSSGSWTSIYVPVEWVYKFQN